MSIMMSPWFIFQFVVKSLTRRRDTFIFHAASRACPSSSIVSAITEAPCSTTIGMIFMYREVGPSPSSKFTELITLRPPSCFKPASITAGSVESKTIGKVDAVENRCANSAMSAAPSRPT